MTDSAFSADADGLRLALRLLLEAPGAPEGDRPPGDLGEALPETGVGEADALIRLAPRVLGRAADLGAPAAFAHMDPPTPWIAWALALWTASRNQNLLHPETAPEARAIERRVVRWLASAFGMDGGHMTSGSTLANLTALWAAREARGVRRVVSGAAAHVSVKKAARLLGLEYVELGAAADGAIDPRALSRDLDDACLVLTAGTTSTGAVDPLGAETGARWTHVDAAWAGPLRLSQTHGSVLDGIERADSVAVSAHKWLFQPKESALVLFRDAAEAHGAVSYGGGYLAAPNVGVLGSHGATAAPLLATLLAFGRRGVAARVDRAMAAAAELAGAIEAAPGLELWGPPTTGVLAWRPRDAGAFEAVFAALPQGSTSRTTIDGRPWLRNVAANPNVDVALLVDAVKRAAAASA